MKQQSRAISLPSFPSFACSKHFKAIPRLWTPFSSQSWISWRSSVWCCFLPLAHLGRILKSEQISHIKCRKSCVYSLNKPEPSLFERLFSLLKKVKMMNKGNSPYPMLNWTWTRSRHMSPLCHLLYPWLRVQMQQGLVPVPEVRLWPNQPVKWQSFPAGIARTWCDAIAVAEDQELLALVWVAVLGL